VLSAHEFAQTARIPFPTGFQPVSDGGHLAGRGGFAGKVEAESPDYETARMLLSIPPDADCKPALSP
jgi:hypothetical protein